MLYRSSLARSLSVVMLLAMLGSTLPPHAAAQYLSVGTEYSTTQSQHARLATAHMVSLPLITTEGTPPQPFTIETTIPAGQGGTLATPDGNVRFQIAPHAVTTDLRVRFTELPTPSVSTPEFGTAGPAFAINAFDAASNVQLTQFPHAVTIISPTADLPATSIMTPSITLAVRYSDADVWGLDTRTLSLYTRENAREPWRRVPTAVYPDQKLMVAELDHLSEFVPMAALSVSASGGQNKRLVLDPDDDVANTSWPGVGTVRELAYSMRLARDVKQRLETDKCHVDILLTRASESERFVSQSVRAQQAVNFGSETFTTLAFNSFVGSAWGVQRDGGVRAWARTGRADDVGLAQGFFNAITQYTGRPHTLGVQQPVIRGYETFNGLPGTYAHIETLFLDHNYDWPVINTAFSRITDATYTALRARLEAQGMTCGDDPLNPPPYPQPPSAAELQRLRDLGFQNYQRYGADPVSFSTGNHILQVPLANVPGRC